MYTVEQTSQERNWAVGTHLAYFLGLVLPFGSILGPLIIWLVKKNESEFVDKNGKAAVNFQISLTIYTLIIVSIFLTNLFKIIPQLDGLDNNAGPNEVFSILGTWMFWIIPLVFLSLFRLIFTVIAAINANDGKIYRYPLSIPFVR